MEAKKTIVMKFWYEEGPFYAGILTRTVIKPENMTVHEIVQEQLKKLKDDCSPTETIKLMDVRLLD